MKYAPKLRPEDLAKRGLRKVKRALKMFKAAKLFKMNQNNDFTPASQEVMQHKERTKRYLDESDVVQSEGLSEDSNLGLPCIRR